MALPERKISVVPAAPSSAPGSMEARLVSLEEEARQLRAELAEMQDELRWLAGDEPESGGLLSRGWLARGWVRASLLLATVGFVSLVSVPYLLHLLDPSGRPADPVPAAAARAVSAAPPLAPAPPTTLAVPERIPAPERVRTSVAPDPTRVLPEERRPVAARRQPALVDAGGSSGADGSPVRGESP
jgi:hypothetical protein